MDIQIKQAKLDQKLILEKLLQLYFYDLSKIFDRDIQNNGDVYAYKYLDLYWKEPERIPYLVYVNDKLAGFVLVNEHILLDDDKGAKAIAEFFIVRKYRKKEIGEKVALNIFDKFIGKWEVAVDRLNTVALNFWEKVINKYTDGKFNKIVLDNKAWKGPVYSFNNSQV